MTGRADCELSAYLAAVQGECEKLKRPLVGLEMFSREGNWMTIHFSNIVDEMVCWEINGNYLTGLAANIPKATICQVDSIAHAKATNRRFDLISIDNPQGIFGDYCEHFEAIEGAATLIKDAGVLAFPVNIQPYLNKQTPSRDHYGMTSHDTWFKRRADFYGRPAHKVELSFVEDFYRAKLATLGLATIKFHSCLMRSKVVGHPDYLLRCAARVERLR